MLAQMIVFIAPGVELRSGVIEPEEKALIEQLVAHPIVECVAKAFLHRLTGRGAMPNDLVVQRS